MKGKKNESLENSIEQERIRFSIIARRLGPKLSGLMVVCGLLVFVFGAYVIINPPDPVLSPRLSTIFSAALGFVGILNIACGFLLLLEEY